MKVTCDVIEDLLPSYADGLLSDDSRELVEEHLNECDSCRRKLEEMRDPEDSAYYDPENADHAEERSTASDLFSENECSANSAREFIRPGHAEGRISINEEESAAPLRKIRRKLLRRLVTGMIVAALIAAAAVRLYSYFYYEKETYIPYESADIYLDDNKLVIGRSIAGNRLHAVYSPDQTVEFLYLADTAYSRNEYPATRQLTVLMDFDNPYDSSVDDADAPGYLDTVTKVYYVSEDMVDELDTIWKMEDQGTSESEIIALVNKIEGKSILLWEK